MTGPLKAPCEHGRYDEHTVWPVVSPDYRCPGGTFLPADTLVIVKEDGEWPEWALRRIPVAWDMAPATLLQSHEVRAVLDALAAAPKEEA